MAVTAAVLVLDALVRAVGIGIAAAFFPGMGRGARLDTDRPLRRMCDGARCEREGRKHTDQGEEKATHFRVAYRIV